MSGTNSPHNRHQQEPRDPIMEDNKFSLRYGNPIQVIHDCPKHKIDTFEPSKNHAPCALAEAVGDTIKEKEHHNSSVKNSPNLLRDATLYSEYIHNKDGSITEIDHDK